MSFSIRMAVEKFVVDARRTHDGDIEVALLGILRLDFSHFRIHDQNLLS